MGVWRNFMRDEKKQREPRHGCGCKLQHDYSTWVYRLDDKARNKTHKRYTTAAHHGSTWYTVCDARVFCAACGRECLKNGLQLVLVVSVISKTKRPDPVYAAARVKALPIVLEQIRSTLVAAQGGETIKRALLRVHSSPASIKPQRQGATNDCGQVTPASVQRMPCESVTHETVRRISIRGTDIKMRPANARRHVSTRNYCLYFPPGVFSQTCLTPLPLRSPRGGCKAHGVDTGCGCTQPRSGFQGSDGWRQ